MAKKRNVPSGPAHKMAGTKEPEKEVEDSEAEHEDEEWQDDDADAENEKPAKNTEPKSASGVQTYGPGAPSVHNVLGKDRKRL